MNALSFKIFGLFALCLAAGCVSLSVKAQSTDQSFPTPVTANEISGKIKARDVGDPRVTTYFYVFDGGQGDIFINVVTKNLSGGIDIFTADGLRPLTKMVIYTDTGGAETGRLVYLRKPERLLLRVEARSPNDDPAIFRIKFAGSFIALSPTKADDEPKTINQAKKDASGIRVNSVGTIIEKKPKPVPPKKVEVEKAKTAEITSDKPKSKESPANASNKPVVVVEDYPNPNDKAEPIKKTVEPTPKQVVTRPIRRKNTARTAKRPIKQIEPPEKTEENKPDPLASIRLVIQMKDGSVIEKPLSEVLKFSVDKGALTVIGKDGNIVRYSILVVAKVTIE